MTDKFSKGEKNHKYKIDKKQSKDGIHMDYPVVFADNGGLYAHAFRYELLGDFPPSFYRTHTEEEIREAKEVANKELDELLRRLNEMRVEDGKIENISG